MRRNKVLQDSIDEAHRNARIEEHERILDRLVAREILRARNEGLISDDIWAPPQAAGDVAPQEETPTADDIDITNNIPEDMSTEEEEPAPPPAKRIRRTYIHYDVIRM